MIIQAPPSIVPLMELIELYEEVANNSKSATVYNIYKMVIADLEEIIREVKGRDNENR